MQKMDQDLKPRLLEALRSGRYKQGRERLLHCGRYCCLGVTYHLIDPNIYPRCLPPGWEDRTGISLDAETHLIHMNDNGKTFDEIANWIEANL